MVVLIVTTMGIKFLFGSGHVKHGEAKGALQEWPPIGKGN